MLATRGFLKTGFHTATFCARAHFASELIARELKLISIACIESVKKKQRWLVKQNCCISKFMISCFDFDEELLYGERACGFEKCFWKGNQRDYLMFQDVLLHFIALLNKFVPYRSMSLLISS